MQFTFPTAPHRLIPAETPSSSDSTWAALNHRDAAVTAAIDQAYGWWRRAGESPPIYDGMAPTFDTLATTILTDGPFDGVIGFSQGGALAGMLAAALDGRAFPPGLAPSSPFSSNPPLQPPLRFCIVYSGFRGMDARCDPLFEPRIATLGLHFLGQLDGVVEESRSQALINSWDQDRLRVVVHPGGHFLPSQRPWLDAAVGFVQDVLDEKGPKGRNEKKSPQDEERVEDMDVPF